MANHPSAIKRNRQRIRRAARNRAVRSTLRTTLKKARAAISAGEKELAEKAAVLVEKAFAKAAGKGVVHQKTAARATSRVFRALSKME